MRSRILARGVLLLTSVVVAASRLHSQSPQPLDQKRLAFEVASVKSDQSDTPATSRFALGPGDAFAPGGLFAATNQPLIVYLRFAYKLGQTDLLLGLPGWVYEERFDIEARAPGRPTKDEMRLMMQSLIAERFKLRTHTERRTQSVFHLMLAKAGKTGPQLQRHPDDGSCTTASRLQLPPIPCGSVGPVPASMAGRGRIVANGVTMTRIASFLKNPFTGVDRPVVDRTGLTGAFDMSVEWSLAPDPPQSSNSQVEDAGPTFLEALREQLGLKLKSTKGLVDVLVIDHVERPTPD
jgi:uncharacterized protein (TIGR03435 family)